MTIFNKPRPRRLRQNQFIRDLVQEHRVTANDLIYPLFIKDDELAHEEIQSMPGIYRWGIESLLRELEDVTSLGIKAIALFPVIDSSLKSEDAQESYNHNGLTQRAIKAIKANYPELLVISDVALDPYTSHGHDGLLKDGRITNDATVEVLSRMALAQAEAGADIVAPSDMMDGRVQAIRESLESNGFEDTLIMSYTAKYASALYGPFRDALGSLGSSTSKVETELEQELNGGLALLTKTETIPKDKKTYQMNIANSKEALKELELDISEGADIVMVKPAGWYCDVIQEFKANTNLPVAAYQVSGEYSMIHAAAQAGYIDLDQAIIESLTSIKRAGADIILSYFAKNFIADLQVV